MSPIKTFALCIFAFFAFFAFKSSAQDYVVTNANDTIYGKLGVEDKVDLIHFKPEDGKHTKFQTSELSSFYRAKKELSKYVVKLGEEYVFAERLIDGPMSYYKQQLTKVEGEHRTKILHYIFHKEGNDAVIIFPVKKKDGVPYLEYMFEDQPELVDEIHNMKFNNENIQAVIQKYNQAKQH